MAEVSGYALKETPEEASCAGCRDWFAERFGRPGFTVEAGRGRNPLPLSAYAEMREDLFPLMTAAAALAPSVMAPESAEK